MDGFDHLTNIIALTLGTAWASGINLYAAVLMLGVLGAKNIIQLPAGLEMLAHPWVIGAAGCIYVVEFIADKVPGVDTVWDVLHTFIRIPAGVILAVAAVGHVDTGLAVAAGLGGGTLSLGSHALKSGTRIVAHLSPEPFSNWTLSLGEDALVVAGIWSALNHPWIFLFLLLFFFMIAIWSIARLWKILGHKLRSVDTVFRRFLLR
ncbi:DUF4126 domain-containing protein [Desulfobulbus oligotrophicus]|jgi:hypothetical protein|uniref:DUF4126 domain-containing protein n=1 Tax=Desulfobulbus oligotrophicus TaxID=1909699 RepID=A0A7T6AQU9_9BACT|nr:DUF4126 domain-containing protein [Desulfobulbus oligotrophicus]MDY0391006.1 DUF4126 domain-containing protein [Desulfobulbus oligotrophicus]QQG66188.1 DUF4126 domain-containing protein [Desulfobulbus oligotrophicus]